jgi:hypothetical protein
MRNSLTALFLSLLAIVTAASPAAAQANNSAGEFSVLLWTPEPVLTLQSGMLTNVTGIATVDFVQEFGIAKKTFPEFRLVAGGSHNLRFSYVPVRYDAEAIIQRTITFRGQTFNVGAPASTNIKWDIWRFGYQWDFVSRERGYLGFVAELKYNTLDAGIESPLLAAPATTEQKAAIPTFGVAARGYVHPNVAITGEFTGFSIDLDEEEFEGEAWDFDIGAFVTFGDHVGVQGGYRSVKVEYTVDDDSGNLELRGLYFGGIVKF